MTNGKIFLILFLFFLFNILLPTTASAQSSYVLPYPSSMPGSRFYQLHLIWEKIGEYWYFGNFGQFNYNLKQSDKYLVKTKTLFEYKQFLLGQKALLKSNFYFRNTKPFLLLAQKENKDIFQKSITLKNAATKHIEVLRKIENDTPETFLWKPEKLPPTTLELKKTIDEAIGIRKGYL